MTTEGLREGRLEQSCGDCGRWEAAGSYCTGCYRRMERDDWYPNGEKAGRAVGQERAAEIERTRVKRGRGRPPKAAVPA